ncbi:hypothetical protein B1T46_28795, partial [Mycobacterium kansasii]
MCSLGSPNYFGEIVRENTEFASRNAYHLLSPAVATRRQLDSGREVEVVGMSLVIAMPEMVALAATDLTSIGSTISSANAAAAVSTTGLLAAGADEVSATIASLFSQHAAEYQALSAQVVAFHSQFVQTLNSGAAAYAGAEAANVQQNLLDLINQPFLALTGRPLIGNGTDGTSGPVGTGGGPGGWLLGNGGNGGDSTNVGVTGG